MTAINGFKSDIKDFLGAQFEGRLGQAEDQISDMEDALASEKTKVLALEKQACELTSKINCLENRNHRSNLRLVNLPEKVEKRQCSCFSGKVVARHPWTRDLPCTTDYRSSAQAATIHYTTSHDFEVLKLSRQDLSHAGSQKERQDLAWKPPCHVFPRHLHQTSQAF